MKEIAATKCATGHRLCGVRMTVYGVLIVGTLIACLFRGTLRNAVLEEGLMLNNAPTEAAIEQVLDAAPDRQAAIRKFWDTGKIIDREVAIRKLASAIAPSEPVPSPLRSWVLAAALDPDMNVREAALAILRDHKDPALAAVCAAELTDIDPQARILGLDNLRPIPAETGVPLIVPLLDDSDPTIVGRTLSLLERWTGAKFGVKVYETVAVENQQTGLMEYGEQSAAKAKAGADRAKAWWSQHRSEFASAHLEMPSAPPSERKPVLAGNFALPTLEGKRVDLSELRGKVVLLNFWTTWCTACIGEMPLLNNLQKTHNQHLAILGVSLDFVPDEDGDGGHEVGSTGAIAQNHAVAAPSPVEVRKKIARTVKARGINYTVLLDEKGQAGAQYNGGELPTTVIVDAQGNVRRRFIGARPLPVLEAMVAEASQPLH